MAVELKLILLPQPVQSKNKLSLAISVTKRRLVCCHISCEYAQIVPGKLFLKLLVEAGLSTVFWIQQFYFK